MFLLGQKRFSYFKKAFPSPKLCKNFSNVTKAYTKYIFNEEIGFLKEIKKEVYGWMVKRDKNIWARHTFDAKVKTGQVTNNITESFNNWI
ncbi:hypothetical protein AXF42_Ash005570 [Apostasia shenzhenica]|uniref:Uncharacterized protein n=1 Tax=Apostasia shenzhenica TaxID=1088818 RepID=A0A2I0B7A8_9ASPA|nr:hypothetical protein AXF42_Ash005570 [Apostasia shenzhenica]